MATDQLTATELQLLREAFLTADKDKDNFLKIQEFKEFIQIAYEQVIHLTKIHIHAYLYKISTQPCTNGMYEHVCNHFGCNPLIGIDLNTVRDIWLHSKNNTSNETFVLFPPIPSTPTQSDNALVEDDPSAALSTSQRQTYQTLVAMGFDLEVSDLLTVAQMYVITFTIQISFCLLYRFGSNVQGAIDCVISGNVESLTISSTPQPEPSINPMPDIANVPMKQSEITPFRVTSTSYILMSGYMREKLLDDYHIPLDIMRIIIKYTNLYFIRLNYNIHNDALHKIKRYVPSVLSITDNKSLRQIAIDIEVTFFNKLISQTNVHTDVRRVHLWSKFCQLQSIYPIDNKNMNLCIHMIQNYGNKHGMNRWVEIPNDFEDVSVFDFDHMICTNMDDEKESMFEMELGVEIFDEANKKWPFMNPKLVPTIPESQMPGTYTNNNWFLQIILIQKQQCGQFLCHCHCHLQLQYLRQQEHQYHCQHLL